VTTTLRDRLDDRWTDIERVMSPDDMQRYRAEAIARRGTGHIAGPHERSLRMIGRHIDEHRLEAVTLIQDRSEGSWLMWHGTDAAEGPRLAILDGDVLLLEDARAAAERQAREPTPPSHVHRAG
jgi:hypothetical protein